MPRAAVLAGWVLAQLPVTALTLAATLVALAVGFRPHAGVTGLAGSGAHYVGLGIVWCAGITAAILPLCAALFRRR